VKVVETFLEAILRKHFFSSSVVVLMMPEASPNRRPFNADFSQVAGTNQLQSSQESIGYAPVLSHHFFFFFSSPKSKRRNQPLVCHFSVLFLLNASLRKRGMLSTFIPSSSNSCKLHQRIPGAF
jgi:hypothetical protein